MIFCSNHPVKGMGKWSTRCDNCKDKSNYDDSHKLCINKCGKKKEERND